MSTIKLSITARDPLECSSGYKDIVCAVRANFNVPRGTGKDCDFVKDSCAPVRRKVGTFKMSDLFTKNCLSC